MMYSLWNKIKRRTTGIPKSLTKMHVRVMEWNSSIIIYIVYNPIVVMCVDPVFTSENMRDNIYEVMSSAGHSGQPFDITVPAHSHTFYLSRTLDLYLMRNCVSKPLAQRNCIPCLLVQTLRFRDCLCDTKQSEEKYRNIQKQISKVGSLYRVVPYFR
jgi:hypothetical protein